jgi:uncharacterized membrane protein/nitrite reductase/ring-hydroxylating ferredoxin subunit
MKSRANIKGHPVHPMLIPFPVAFFTGTLIFDILGLAYDHTTYWIIGQHLGIAGIIGGLVAAVPGLIDYFSTVPPDSSAKKRATLHGLTNITMLLIFSVAAFYRRSDSAMPVLVIALEAAGFILMSIAGWMGATLVYRNQIGVDPRYANAGKWKEQKVEHSSDPIFVADIDELQLNQMKLILAGSKRIVLARTEKGYVAFSDRCTHKGGSLAGGSMMCGTVQCPWHGSQFNVHNGTVTAGPADKKVEVYSIAEIAGKVYITL